MDTMLKELQEEIRVIGKKVDIISNMLSDLMEQLDAGRHAHRSSREEAMRHLASSKEMLLNMPSLRNNPMAAQVLNSVFSMAVPHSGQEGSKE